MKTFLPQNQFNSVDGSPPSPTDTAAAPSPGKGDAAAERFDEPPSNEGRSEETPASAPTKNPDVGVLDATDCIHEIFHYVRKLMKQPPRFVLDEAEFMADVEEVPLFIREDGYLKRQA